MLCYMYAMVHEHHRHRDTKMIIITPRYVSSLYA